MKKTELIAALAAKIGVSKDLAGKFVDAFIETAQEEVKADREINLTGFGKFKLSHRSARNGVNPQTGARIQIAATKTPTFVAGKAFKDAVK